MENLWKLLLLAIGILSPVLANNSVGNATLPPSALLHPRHSHNNSTRHINGGLAEGHGYEAMLNGTATLSTLFESTTSATGRVTTQRVETSDGEMEELQQQRQRRLGNIRRRLEINETDAIDLAEEWLANVTATNQTIPEDRQAQLLALATFYYATIGVNWTISDNWLNVSVPECTWYNQAPQPCDRGDRDQFYQAFALSGNTIGGILPSAIAELFTLQVLDLSDNNMTGTMPYEMGQMENLITLVLRNNQLTGELPDSLANLKALIELDLNTNLLSGSLPLEWGDLSNLEVLNLYFNDFLTGTIPSQLFGMESLLELNLEFNYFSGTLTEYVGLSSTLEVLILEDNYFSGQLPDDLNNVTSLILLNLVRLISLCCCLAKVYESF